MRDRFRTGKGRLTLYAFVCGYIERRPFGEGSLTLYLDGVWHIKSEGSSERVWITLPTETKIGHVREEFDNILEEIMTPERELEQLKTEIRKLLHESAELVDDGTTDIIKLLRKHFEDFRLKLKN